MHDEDRACAALSDDEFRALQNAERLLETNHFVAKMISLLGDFVDMSAGWVGRNLPHGVTDTLQEVTRSALSQSLAAAIVSVDKTKDGATRWQWLNRQISSEWLNKAAAMVSGGVGGAFGVPSALAEIPVTTTIIMRAVAQIAHDEGEDLTSDEARAECLHVFAFGGPGKADDEFESGYYSARAALATALEGLAGKTFGELLPKQIAEIAPRFGVQLTWKIAGEAVPIVGALAGAMINLAFVDHFQDRARGHFIVRRLERVHGETYTRACYERIKRVRTESEKQRPRVACARP